MKAIIHVLKRLNYRTIALLALVGLLVVSLAVIAVTVSLPSILPGTVDVVVGRPPPTPLGFVWGG